MILPTIDHVWSSDTSRVNVVQISTIKYNIVTNYKIGTIKLAMHFPSTGIVLPLTVDWLESPLLTPNNAADIKPLETNES